MCHHYLNAKIQNNYRLKLNIVEKHDEQLFICPLLLLNIDLNDSDNKSYLCQLASMTWHGKCNLTSLLVLIYPDVYMSSHTAGLFIAETVFSVGSH